MKEHIAMILAERFCKKDPYQILGKNGAALPRNRHSQLAHFNAFLLSPA